MANGTAPGAQEAVATAKYIRMSPTKARQVVDLIRGRHVEDARRVLRFTSRAASTPVGKVLESAIANAEHNGSLPADELIVARAWVDEGPTLRRFRPRALGRATRIRKRTCHISVVVARPEEEHEEHEETEAPARKRSTRRPGAGKPDESKPERKESQRKSTAKSTAKKTTAKKTTAKKTTAKKKSTRKSTSKKTTTKKTTTEKPAAKTTAKKTTRKKDS
jgi:large subunit ribosomal protein L22